MFTSCTSPERDLVKTTGDLFLAGTETTSTTIAWALLFFLHHPEVQDKCYKELCDVIGTGRLPSMQDKPEMTYLEATTMEVLRKGEIAPFAVQHSTPHDVTFQGYVIPQDAVILPNLDSVLLDKETWGDPDNFRPERFIGLDGKIVKPEGFIPFSIGRRVCLGESLARMELFLYLSTLIQRFRFLPPEQETLPPLEGVMGITYCPKSYKIRAIPRE
ncbi:hypothetical protein V1264_022791 [Littorina saxatilis]|uniref:Cytochrome P450 n=1 Tax=Littorina saxatilis TaxID=31220 RepID=A0AAN9B9Y6_9CAEN